MLTFLFWNLSRKPLATRVARLADRHSVDVLILAESALPPADLLRALDASGGTPFQHAPTLCEAVAVYTRFPSRFMAPMVESDHYTIRRMNLPDRDEINVAALHLPSKLHQSEVSQQFQCLSFARDIAAVEDRVGHQLTVVLGDFNMNPWEPGMVAAEGLHAVMSRRVANRAERKVKRKAYRYFYNPTWGHLGDVRDSPAGTFFYDRAEQVNY